MSETKRVIGDDSRGWMLDEVIEDRAGDPVDSAGTRYGSEETVLKGLGVRVDADGRAEKLLDGVVRAERILNLCHK